MNNDSCVCVCVVRAGERENCARKPHCFYFLTTCPPEI